MLLPAHLMFWSTFLVLIWFTQIAKTEENNICDAGIAYVEEYASSELEFMDDLESKIMDNINEEKNFSCFLSSTNVLNCSWSFHTLQEDVQFSLNISICNSTTPVGHLCVFEDKVGSDSVVLPDYEELKVIVLFNVSLHNRWKVYSYAYDIESLEAPSPPPNIAASVKHGELSVTWGVPHTRVPMNPDCFEYQLNVSDQEKIRDSKNSRFYNQSADPNHTYRVKIRARKKSICSENFKWSDWSHIVKVEQPSQLNTLVIVLISFGIPMILLALVLLVRYQRVSNILFPPIPRPPLKYKLFLERRDAFNFFHPQSAQPEEVITEVEHHCHQRSRDHSSPDANDFLP